MTAHQSVEATSAKMWTALRRRNYVTPTNYLETVRGYKDLLAEKRAELGEKAAKLQGGLQKLDETSVQVAAMKKVAEEKKVVVAQAKADCEELLVEIVQDKRVADEQEKQVGGVASTRSTEIEVCMRRAGNSWSSRVRLAACIAGAPAVHTGTKWNGAELPVCSVSAVR